MYIHIIYKCQYNVKKAECVPKKDRDAKGKKDSQLVLRLDKEERERFVDLCKDLDTTAAREIRHFIREFLKKHGTK